MTVTPRQEFIYNTYLKVSRTIKGKPFRFRRNFTNLNQHSKDILYRLELFFDQYNHVSIEDFFKAPFHVYSKDDYFDLEFYLTRKAIKCYTTYQTNLNLQDPDSDQAIEITIQSLAFIAKYCISHNISLNEYIAFNDTNTPLYITHLREHKINFYALHALDNSKNVLKIDNELLEFIVKNFRKYYDETFNKYVKSTKLKAKTKQAIQKIEKYIDKTLEKQNQESTIQI